MERSALSEIKELNDVDLFYLTVYKKGSNGDLSRTYGLGFKLSGYSDKTKALQVGLSSAVKQLLELNLGKGEYEVGLDIEYLTATGEK